MVREVRPGEGTADQAPVGEPEPDAYGQAALLLSESMLHLLIEAKVLTPDQATNAVRTASAVKHEVAEEACQSASRAQQSVRLLHRIERSLESMVDA